MPRPSLRYRLARLTGGRLGAPTAEIAASLRALRLDRRELCRRVHLEGWRRVGEMAVETDGALRLEIDPSGAWPVALRGAAIFAEARIVGDGRGLPWGPELVKEVRRSEPTRDERTTLAGVAPLADADLRLRCTTGDGGDSFQLEVQAIETESGKKQGAAS